MAAAGITAKNVNQHLAGCVRDALARLAAVRTEVRLLHFREGLMKGAEGKAALPLCDADVARIEKTCGLLDLYSRGYPEYFDFIEDYDGEEEEELSDEEERLMVVRGWVLACGLAEVALRAGDRADAERVVREVLGCDYNWSVELVTHLACWMSLEEAGCMWGKKEDARVLGLLLHEVAEAAMPGDTGPAVREAVRTDGARAVQPREKFKDVSELVIDMLVTRVAVYASFEENDDAAEDEKRLEEVRDLPDALEYSQAATAVHDALGDQLDQLDQLDQSETTTEVPDLLGKKRAIPAVPFRRLVDEICADTWSTCTFDARAIAVLQEAAERFVRGLDVDLDDPESLRGAVATRCKAHGGGCVCDAAEKRNKRKR